MQDTFGVIHIDLQEKPVIRQIGYVYFWEGELKFLGKTYPIRPNYGSLTPPDTPVTWRFPQKRCEHFYSHFRLASSEESSIPIPVIQDLGGAVSEISRAFEKAITFYKIQPLQAEVILWNILWDIADPRRRTETSMQVLSTPVNASLAIIRNELRYRPMVSEIADRVGVSQNHLNRLFKREKGMTVNQYIQSERIKKVNHLLKHSNLPIRVVADEVGISNPQYFNKFVRKHFGMAPRKYRGNS
jgi:AraC family transcriptional regulator